MERSEVRGEVEKTNMFNFLKQKITVATHNGSFHADEVFGCAVLSLWAEKNGKRIAITRTRDKNIIDKADIVLDVGMTYEPEKNRYDHHQKGGAGIRENSISYAAFGLIWKHFGEKLCSKEAAKLVENKLVIPVDAGDNGIEISSRKFDISEYALDEAMKAIRASDENDIDRAFMTSVAFAKKIVAGEIKKATAKMEGFQKVTEIIKAQNEPEVLVLDEFLYWGLAVKDHKNIKFIVHPDRTSGDWCAQTIQENPDGFHSEGDRSHFPVEWAGLRDAELEKVSGVKGAVFCINGRWFTKAKTKEAAIALAKKALEQNNMLER